MGLIHALRPGELGTPEFMQAIKALTQLADLASGGSLVCPAQPDAAASSAAALNSAAAGTVTKTVRLELVDGNNVRQTWFNGQANLTPIETVTDANVAAPTVAGGNTVNFVDGVATVVITYDTDAGATKTYVAGETVGFTTAIADILGVTVNVAGAGFTDTLVA
ncbi:MAG: hypothetical protein JW990_18250 [Thermoleophilia bacterium]|nr:hypothetical protein [Thermoleophilia bacterium]